MVTRYVSPLGLDTNSGLTKTAPLRTPKAAVNACAVGDRIEFLAGYCYEPTNGFFPRIQKDNITIDWYGYGTPAVNPDPYVDYPCWDALYYEPPNATGWFHEGGGVWSKKLANANAKVRRLWIESRNNGLRTIDRVIGTAYTRTPIATPNNLTDIKAALNADDIWHPGDASLGWKTYIYTGSSTIAPPAFYNGLAVILSDGATVGATEGYWASKCSGARAYHLHTRGVTGENFIVTSSQADAVGTDDVVIEDCLGTCMGVGGFRIRPAGLNSPDPEKLISNVYMRRVIGNSMSSAEEQDKTTAYSNVVTLDMFSILGHTYNCHIEDFEAINSCHVGIVIGNSGNNQFVPVDCTIKNGLVHFDDWVTYGRGVATSRCGTGCEIDNVHIVGQNVRSQIVDGHITNVIWWNMRESIRKPNTSEWFYVEAYVHDGGLSLAGDNRYVRLKPTDLLVAHCVCIRPKTPNGAPVVLTTYASNPAWGVENVNIGAGTIRMHNNIVIDDQNNARTYWFGCFENGGTIGQQDVSHNVVYAGVAQAQKQVRWKGTYYATNSAPGFSNHLFADPLLDSETFKPSVDSPCIGAGLNLNMGLTDADGLPFKTTPSIGAYEYYASDVDLTSASSQAQRIAANASTAYVISVSTKQGQRVSASVFKAISGTATTRQGQTVNAFYGAGAEVEVTTKQGQRIAGFAATYLDLSVSTAQTTASVLASMSLADAPPAPTRPGRGNGAPKTSTRLWSHEVAQVEATDPLPERDPSYEFSNGRKFRH